MNYVGRTFTHSDGFTFIVIYVNPSGNRFRTFCYTPNIKRKTRYYSETSWNDNAVKKDINKGILKEIT